MTTMNNAEPQWMKITTAAAICSTTPQAIRNWIKQGLLKPAGTGNKRRFITCESFKKFMEKFG